MEHIKGHFADNYRAEPGLVGLVLVENPYPYNPLIDGLDLLVLVLIKNDGAINGTEHVQIEGKRVLVRTIDPNSLNEWLSGGENRNIIEWLVRGEILMDRDGYLGSVRERLLQFPDSMREQKQFTEFAGFLRTYLLAKQDLLDGNLLDAYSHVLTALHHWAHIVLIEEGRHPELTIWKQLKRVHPGIYKLYEELTVSPETLEQRVQLVLLGCEFSVMNKMKTSCSLLFQILESREEPWSIAELQSHKSINVLHVDLSLVLQKLVQREYIREVAVMHEPSDTGALELRYMI
ncbi:nucleotidyltransferase-like protein [Paenibacillus alkaliterrae]|uniref:nucleotidyltransferase-like protein n=1 Tax=Paenibacillus alkaliterrae TaxID=320909 RepID=UPI001F1BD293|nr:nucleotidyltransferase-like protein [Paenibacillus alkaliterrae]MCF2939082.1 nucleotidyltransferase-like protein [Paenibacillus alkaliterrae]